MGVDVKGKTENEEWRGNILLAGGRGSEGLRGLLSPTTVRLVFQHLTAHSTPPASHFSSLAANSSIGGYLNKSAGLLAWAMAVGQGVCTKLAKYR